MGLSMRAFLWRVFAVAAAAALLVALIALIAAFGVGLALFAWAFGVPAMLILLWLLLCTGTPSGGRR